MKKSLLALLMATSLAGCVTTTDIDKTVAEVQSYTRTICKFVPTVTVIAKILAGSSFVDSAGGIAAGICDALSTAPLADGPGRPGAYYRGVRIEGVHVK